MASAAELIRRRRALRPQGTRRHVVVPVQAHPHNIEREYARVLEGLVRSMHEGIIEAIPPLFHVFDQDDDTTDALKRALDKVAGVEAQVERTVTRTKVRLLAQGIGRKVERFSRNAVGEQIKAVIGVDPMAAQPVIAGATEALVDRFARENITLVKSIPERYFDQVRAIVTESVQVGRRASSVSELLQERFDVAKYNADRIARDQVSKLNGKMTKARQTSLGIDRYTWRTARDERVRDVHKDLDGKSFTWASGGAPGEGHPGEPIMCRCRAEPDMSALLGE